MTGFKQLMETISQRRSHRKYLSDPVSQEDILRMVDAARKAPSAHNSQPWKVLALTGRDRIRSLAEAVDGEYQALVNLLPEDARKEPEKFGFYVRHFGEAPLVFFILARKSETDWNLLEKLHGVAVPKFDGFDMDSLGVGAFIQNLLLAAEALGYGACWVAAPAAYAQTRVEDLLGVEPPWHLVSVVPVGRPVKERMGPPRKEVSEILTIIP